MTPLPALSLGIYVWLDRESAIGLPRFVGSLGFASLLATCGMLIAVLPLMDRFGHPGRMGSLRLYTGVAVGIGAIALYVMNFRPS